MSIAERIITMQQPSLRLLQHPNMTGAQAALLRWKLQQLLERLQRKCREDSHGSYKEPTYSEGVDVFFQENSWIDGHKE